MLKAVLINSASALSDAAYYTYFFGPSSSPPLPDLRAKGGFGIPSLVRGLSFLTVGSDTRVAGQLPTLLLPGIALVKSQTARNAPPFPLFDGNDPAVSDGGVICFCVDIRVPPPGALGLGGALPLSVTLVWTDPAGSPAASIALVNDLDLEVTPPDSSVVFYGNGNSENTGLHRPDRLNNVEKLTFSRPNATLDFASHARTASPWKIAVRGFYVPFGPQAFSLVVTGSEVALTSPTGSCVVDPPPQPPAAPDGLASAAEVRGLSVGISVLALLLLLAGGLLAMLCYTGRLGLRAKYSTSDAGGSETSGISMVAIGGAGARRGGPEQVAIVVPSAPAAAGSPAVPGGEDDAADYLEHVSSPDHAHAGRVDELVEERARLNDALHDTNDDVVSDDGRQDQGEHEQARLL